MTLACGGLSTGGRGMWHLSSRLPWRILGHKLRRRPARSGAGLQLGPAASHRPAVAAVAAALVGRRPSPPPAPAGLPHLQCQQLGPRVRHVCRSHGLVRLALLRHPPERSLNATGGCCKRINVQTHLIICSNNRQERFHGRPQIKVWDGTPCGVTWAPHPPLSIYSEIQAPHGWRMGVTRPLCAVVWAQCCCSRLPACACACECLALPTRLRPPHFRDFVATPAPACRTGQPPRWTFTAPQEGGGQTSPHATASCA